ncbi:SH3 domain-containing protein [Trichonephila clavipes]|uniref:SH3 domain-containing protein n=1 Tax=Trichonephila clavipes TaxID=2585209 RepID=A0A8X7BEI4_TRICX|nr:SH3 domain-containing protein [Trichonephila clavipes]
MEKILALFNFDNTNSKNDAYTAIIPEGLSHGDEAPIVSDAYTAIIPEDLSHGDEAPIVSDAYTAIIPEDLSHEDEVPIVSDALTSENVTSDGSNPSVSGKVTESQSSFEEYQV